MTPVALLAIALLSDPSSPQAAATSERASPADVAQAQVQMFRTYDARVSVFAQRLKLNEPWITYCRVQMNEAHSGHAQDGTLPFGVDYRNLNRDQLAPLINIRSAYEEGFMMKCLADVRTSLRGAGVE